MRNKIILLLITITLVLSCDGFTTQAPNFLVGNYKINSSNKNVNRAITFKNDKTVILNDNNSLKGTYSYKFNKVKHEWTKTIENVSLVLDINNIKVNLEASLTINESYNNEIVGFLVLKLSENNNEDAKELFRDEISDNNDNSVKFRLESLKEI